MIFGPGRRGDHGLPFIFEVLSMRVALCCLLLLFSATAGAVDPPDLIGLWGNETVSGPRLAGTLTIDGRQTPWLASLGGMEVAIERDGNKVRFAMPGGQGHFRGQLVDGDIDGRPA